MSNFNFDEKKQDSLNRVEDNKISNENPKNNIRAALGVNDEDHAINYQSEQNSENIFIKPVGEEKREKNKSYCFSMQPNVHKKLTRLAKEKNYKSVSAFLTYVINNLN